MADVPEAVAHGTVRWRSVETMADGSDAGAIPDAIGSTGTVTLRPGGPTATSLALSVPSEGTTFIVHKVDAKLIDGVLVAPDATDASVPGVVIPSSVQPLGSPAFFSWYVHFDLDGVALRSQPPDIQITVPAGGMVNLASALQAPPQDEISQRIASLRGAPGGLAGLDHDGDVIDALGNKVTGGGGGVADEVAWEDVTGKPTFAPVSNTGAYADLSGKPNLSPVATSGAYSDLTGRPNLSTVATSGDYTDLTGRPTLAPVATSGSYTDLTSRPTIPVVPTTLPPTNGSVGPAAMASGYVAMTSAQNTKLNALPSDAQSAAQVDARADAVITAAKNQPNGVAGLDSAGKLADSVLPPLAIGDTFTVATQAAMLALTAQRGDIAVRTDLDPDGVFLLTADTPSVLGAWVQITTPATVLSVAGKTGTVSLVKADVGLSDVDNTSDADKPLSDDAVAALAAKANVGLSIPDLLADSPTTVPPRSTVVFNGYTGPIRVDISGYPRSTALDAAAVAVMQEGDRLRRRRA